MLQSKFNLTISSDSSIEEDRKAEEHEKEVEIEPVVLERRLQRSEISMRLSSLGKTAEGDGYTYLRATCTDMAINEISSLTFFKHLQFVDLSQNMLTNKDIQILADLPYLILIKINNNFLTSGYLKPMKYLQVLIFNNNKISRVNDIFQPQLRTLEVAENIIKYVEFDRRMEYLRCLDFRYNLLKTIPVVESQFLDSLYLAGNKIKTLEGIDRLVNLRILHMRSNPIKIFDGFDESNAKLQYVNFRYCKVRMVQEIFKLKVLKSLDTLILKGTPYMGGSAREDDQEEEPPEKRITVCAILPKLKRFNKLPFSPEEEEEAKELRIQWREEGEPMDELSLGGEEGEMEEVEL